MVKQRLRCLAKGFLAEVDWRMFEELFRRRLAQDIKVSQALEANFVDEALTQTASDAERLACEHIKEYRARRRESLEGEIFKQKRRLADAQRSVRAADSSKNKHTGAVT
jgi:hypothetical protein